IAPQPADRSDVGRVRVLLRGAICAQHRLRFEYRHQTATSSIAWAGVAAMRSRAWVSWSALITPAWAATGWPSRSTSRGGLERMAQRPPAAGWASTQTL